MIRNYKKFSEILGNDRKSQEIMRNIWKLQEIIGNEKNNQEILGNCKKVAGNFRKF